MYVGRRRTKSSMSIRALTRSLEKTMASPLKVFPPYRTHTPVQEVLSRLLVLPVLTSSVRSPVDATMGTELLQIL